MSINNGRALPPGGVVCSIAELASASTPQAAREPGAGQGNRPGHQRVDCSGYIVASS
ncbi:MAG: hypothetical protein JWL60_202 [Gemmatimonadetes bacterium]|nr:hypothetical protein [Gemmatimonadota bacterium]